ncbi:hypothetical protein C0431_00185 [bacterium]|nr:hypothetical protein [bacterium]
MKLPISVVINTFQAERYLDLVLRSVVDHVEEIVVCDMYSDDRTVEIAEKFGAKVVFHDRVGYVEPARKFAVDQSNQPWVLILDADEVLSPRLWDEFAKLLDGKCADIIEFHWLNYMFGAPMFGAGFEPDRDVHGRLFLREAVTLHSEVHQGLRPVDGMRVTRIPFSDELCVHHFTYLSAEDFIGRVNKYTSVEAGQVFESEKVNFGRVFRKLGRDFWKRMVVKGGNKIGWQGLSVSLLMLANDAMKFAKILELQNGASGESVLAAHRKIAEEKLKN